MRKLVLVATMMVATLGAVSALAVPMAGDLPDRPPIEIDVDPIPHLERGWTGSSPDTWLVEPGDHFWSIAASVVGNSGPIGEYWLKLIGANRRNIRSGDPNLIYPGEELILPQYSSP